MIRSYILWWQTTVAAQVASVRLARAYTEAKAPLPPVALRECRFGRAELATILHFGPDATRAAASQAASELDGVVRSFAMGNARWD